MSAPSRHQVDILGKCEEAQPLTELLDLTGRSDRTKFRNQVLKSLLDQGLLEMIVPDKPRSSSWRYRLTADGRLLILSSCDLFHRRTRLTLSSRENARAKELLAELAGFMDAESRAILHLDDIEAYFRFMRSPQVLASIDEDPARALRSLKCPVLAITGSRDVRLPPEPHLAAIEMALREGGNIV